MKTFNKKLIIPLFITLILTGCMPDSLTKFKKDEPKKAATTTGGTTGPVVDSSGNVIDTSDYVDPQNFKYRSEQTNAVVSEVNVKTGDKIVLIPSWDGSIANYELTKAIFVNCAITPSLPSGVTLSKVHPSGCVIAGVPTVISTNAGAPKNYTVTMTYNKKGGGTGTISTNIAIGAYEPVGNFNYNQNNKNLITVDMNSGSINSATRSTNEDSIYVRSGFVTSEGGSIGVIKFIDSLNLKLGVVKLTPLKIRNYASLSLPAGVEYVGLSTPRFISTLSGKLAKVIRAVPSANTIYVEMISDAAFVANDTLCNVKSCSIPTTAQIEDAEIDYSFSRVTGQPRINLDNNIQYFTNWASITTLARSYQVDTLVESTYPKLEVVPSFPSSMVAENGVTFSVSPQLPDGLSLNETTGAVTGKFLDTVEPAKFQITAKNKISSIVVELNLSGIKKPRDLSYTTRQLVAVKNISNFYAGENLIKPITPPLTKIVDARILRKYADADPLTNENRYKLSINSTSGKLTAGSSLDSGNAFYSEKSFVPSTAVAPKQGGSIDTPIILNYNVAINVASASGFEIGGHVSTTQGSTGRIAGILNNTLFVQTTTLTSPPVHIPFQERLGGVANTIGNNEVFALSTYTSTITQIEANVIEMPMTITDGGTPGDFEFSAGSEITSNGNLAAYVYDVDVSTPSSPIVRVNEITMNTVEPTSTTAAFRYNQVVTDNENLAVAPVDYGTVTNVKSLEHIQILEVGKYSEIQANLGEGNSISYSVSPTLPAGMSLDPKTGLISGTPTVRTTLKPFTISASNLMKTIYYPLEIEVRDYFKISDSSETTTAVLHKYGSFKNSRECKINATDILNGNAGVDVRCFMDVEEKELHTTKLKFTTSTGAGICEFVENNPYYFYRYAPIKTNKTIHVAPNCVTAGNNGVPVGAVNTTPSAAEVCDGNYVTNSASVNCDSGSYEVITYTGTDKNNDNDCEDPGEISISPRVVYQCNGKASNCIEGGVTDLLTRTELNNGFRGTVTASASGLKSSMQLSSPLSHGFNTTLSIANSTISNQCKLTNEDADSWEEYTSTLNPLNSPWAGNPFYTFTCLDGASDIQARIRIVIRDWNKSFKINSLIDLDLPGGTNMMSPLNLMNNMQTSLGKSNNDYADWDDTYNGAAPTGYLSCPTGATTPPGSDYKFPGSKL